jgi:hypothetical protein
MQMQTAHAGERRAEGPRVIGEEMFEPPLECYREIAADQLAAQTLFGRCDDGQ